MEELHLEQDQLVRLDELLDSEEDDTPEKWFNRRIVHRMSLNQARRR